MAIPLGRSLPNASRDRPGRRRGNTAAGCPACRPYLVLLPMGFAVPQPLPVARWALTPPFHPYLRRPSDLRRTLGSGGFAFSVALSSSFPSPGVTRHPALRSPDFPLEPKLERAPVALGRRHHSLGQDTGP